MVIADVIIFIINLIFCILTWIEYFKGGYHEGLTTYNILIANIWMFIAVISIFYSIFTMYQKRLSNFILLGYSVLMMFVLAGIFIFKI